MEHTNILDSAEEKPSFGYGNRSFYCFAGNLLCLGIGALISTYIDEGSIAVGFVEFFGLFLMLVFVFLTLLGSYYSIQGLRLKEAKSWRAGVSLFLHVGLALLLLLSLTFTSSVSTVEPILIPISE